MLKGTNVESPLVSLNNLELLAFFRKFGWRLVASAFSGRMKYSSRLASLYNFGKLVLKIRKNHGQLAAVKYMKSSQLALQKFIAGTPMSSLREIEPDLPLPRLINGLPTIIPKYDRKAIRQDSFSVIRFWNTLFALYKIISCPGAIKISTIIDPFKGDQTFLSDFCSNIGALSTLKIANSFQIRPINTEPRFIFLESSSPTSKVS